MISSTEFKAIAELDLDPIKVKMMQPESGEGWSLEKVNAVEVEYRRFLYLMKKFPNDVTAPQVDVDTFWHYHILDTMKYAEDCQQVFGYFLHHFPYLGMRGEEDLQALQQAGDRMAELYEDCFGAPQQQQAEKNNAWAGSAVEAAWRGAVKEAASGLAWCGVANQAASRAATAWCGAAKQPPAGLAWCGAAEKTDIFSTRPTLEAAA
jgi:hypothetical protein